MSHFIKNASFESDNLGKGGYDILTYGETGACVKKVWEWLAYRIIHYGLITGSIARSAKLPVFNLLRGRF